MAAGIPLAGGFCMGALGIASVDGREGGAGVARLLLLLLLLLLTDGCSGAASVPSGWSGWRAALGGRESEGDSVAAGGFMLDKRDNVEKEQDEIVDDARNALKPRNHHFLRKINSSFTSPRSKT